MSFVIELQALQSDQNDAGRTVTSSTSLFLCGSTASVSLC